MAGEQAAPLSGHAVTPRHVVAGPIDHQLPDKRHLRDRSPTQSRRSHPCDLDECRSALWVVGRAVC
jgi:hypothetical protein